MSYHRTVSPEPRHCGSPPGDKEASPAGWPGTPGQRSGPGALRPGPFPSPRPGRCQLRAPHLRPPALPPPRSPQGSTWSPSASAGPPACSRSPGHGNGTEGPRGDQDPGRPPATGTRPPTPAGGRGRAHQPLLLQQVRGLLPLAAVLVLQLLEPAGAGRGEGAAGRARGAGRPPPARASPLLHLLLHVNALLLQQLTLGEGPVHGLGGRLCAGRALALLPRLLGVVEPEHVALSHDDAVAWGTSEAGNGGGLWPWSSQRGRGQGEGEGGARALAPLVLAGPRSAPASTCPMAGTSLSPQAQPLSAQPCWPPPVPWPRTLLHPRGCARLLRRPQRGLQAFPAHWPPHGLEQGRGRLCVVGPP